MFSHTHSNTNKKTSGRTLAGILPMLTVGVFSVFFFSSFVADVEAQTRTPASGSTANQQGKKAIETTKTVNFDCGILGDSSLEGCILEAVHYVIFQGSSVFFFIGGAIFDTFMALSLSSTYMKNVEFVDFGWVLLRDVANTAFIFVLLYIAIMTILRAKSTNTKEMLVSLIIAALLVNFSLYITRVVIDASNIIAIEFYNKVGAGGQPLVRITDVESRSISEAFLKVSMSRIDGDSQAAFLGPNKEFAKALIILLVGGIFNVVGCFVLLSAGFLFLARTITLWFVMIFSPLAFVAAILPIGNNIWSKWKSTLFSQSFFAPIFLFFLYLTFAFLQNSLLGSSVIQNTGGWTNTPASNVVDILVTVFIPFIVVFAVLSFGLTKAREMAGASGAMAEKFGKLAFGTAVLGGAGLLARSGIGALRLQDREWYKNAKERGGILGKSITGATDKIATSSFDLRATGLTKVTGGENLGAAAGAGGAAAAIAKRRQKQAADINSFANDPRRQANMIARLNDADARAYFQTLPVSKQQELIEKAPTQEKGVLKRISVGLTEGLIGGAGRKEAPHGFLKRLSGERKEKDDARRDALRTQFAQVSAKVGGGVAGAAAQAEFLNTKVSRYDAEKIIKTIDPVQQQAIEAAAIAEHKPLITRLRVGLPDIPATATPTERLEELQKWSRKVTATVNDAGVLQRTVAENKAEYINAIPNEKEARLILSQESAEMRAEMFEDARLDPKVKQRILDLHDKLPETDKERTADAQDRVRTAKKVRESKDAIKKALAVTPPDQTAIDNAIRSLNTEQVSRLDPGLLKKPEVSRHLKASDIKAIQKRSRMDYSDMVKLVEDYVDRKIPIATVPGQQPQKDEKDAIDTLRKNNDPLKDMLALGISAGHRKRLSDLGLI